MSRQDPQNIPSFAASRDEAVDSAPKGAVPSRQSRAGGGAGGGAGAFLKLILTVAVFAAGAACAWAYLLQTELDRSNLEARSLAGRVADLEALLSDTDESVEKSAAALGAQLNVVDKETRRLEQRRRELDGRLEKVEKTATGLTAKVEDLFTKTARQVTSLAAVTADLKPIKAELAALTKVSGDLEKLSKSIQSSQSNMERLADSVNKSTLERAALNKRVTANEEWVESINGFRRQVNTSINRLETELRSLQGTPGQPL